MGVSGISIQLERESGVFYAGEVVRGTVSFTISGSVKCRGLQIHMRGRSHVHWHTGSGDNRTDYDGTTEFQNQRFTLFGNYFKSGVIDNAGSDAYFGRAHGDGVILVPCEDRDLGRMEMIVRVMDYDWGKRDDLLGELVIDAADLARAGDLRSFPLSRNGKPEKGQVTLSAKMVPFGSLFPTNSSATGVAVSTIAVKDQCLVLTVHSATGLRKADWGGRNDVYVQVYRPPAAKEITPGKKLPGPDKMTVLPEGTTTYPFAFQLRNDAPGSAELRAGDRAYVRYDLYAHCVFANWRDPCSRRTISVIPNRPVPKLSLLAPAQQATAPSPIYNCSCCLGCKCCKEQGFVSTALSLGRRAYAPGEQIDLGGKVVNETKKELTVRVKLRQDVVLSTGGYGSASSRFDYDLSTAFCPAGSELDLGTLANMVVPHVYPSFYGGVSGPISRSHYPCLKWTYTIEVSAQFAKESYSSAVHTRIPVLISTAPPLPEAVEKARSMRKDVSADSLSADNPWQIFDQALHGPEPSDTTPKITGDEDGGKIMPAFGIGVVGTSDFSEDKGRLGPAPSYQPVINAFDASTLHPSSPGISTGTTTFATPSAQPIKLLSELGTTDLSSTSNNNGMNQEVGVGISSLLLSVENAYDKRKAVGEFVRDHPARAAKLSPDEVAQILSKVTFSLDQPSVAGELAAVFERSGGMSCAHIVAAMRTCKYSMTDVAKAMAPYANDPQNKDAVLDQLDYSFERDDVAKYFRT